MRKGSSIYSLFLLFLFLLNVLALDAKEISNEVNIMDSLTSLKTQKIYFAHQSVGYNLISGLNLVTLESGLDALNIVETESASDFVSPIFAHSTVGQNKNPKSKIDEFSKNIKSGIGDNVDVAFLKLCYIDIRSNTDIDDVFAYYKKMISNLKSIYPRVTFVHFTIPLMVNKISWKTRLKEISNIGDLWEYKDNVARNKYNELILSEYKGVDPVFDIAYYESLFPEGKRSEFSYKNKNYFCLDSRYTSDGGHLNELGQKWVAANLIKFLGKLSIN